MEDFRKLGSRKPAGLLQILEVESTVFKKLEEDVCDS